MKILNKIKLMAMAVLALGIFFILGSKSAYATESNIASGIYEVENEVYHESETGMAMSRTYLLPSMSVEVTKEHIIYTIGFSGSDYMENYRMKVNGEEVPVEILEENTQEGIVKLKVEVDKVDADMDAIIYVGPMERDVQFKVIPKMDTLTLVEAIEDEVEDIATEETASDESEAVSSHEEDLAVAAKILEGKTVACRTIITPASRKIYIEAIKAGYMETLAKAGAIITQPGCGLCCGRAGGILCDGEKVLATNNRNFLGRMGTSKVGIYLGSPATAATSAIYGKITIPE